MPIAPNAIFQEMMSHPALFFHPHPKKVGIIGDHENVILKEVLKHTKIIEIWQISTNKKIDDPRVQFQESIHVAGHDYFDVIIVANAFSSDQLSTLLNAIHKEGIIVQQSESPFELHAIKQTRNQFLSSGFKDVLTLNFPQPDFPSGWRTAIIAKKTGVFKRIREKDIFSKNFNTLYYNFDVHKAALVLPEFMRLEFTI